MTLARDEMLAPGAPCMIVRVGVDASAQRRAVHTHWWILGLAILSTLIILGINIALYRTLKQREKLAESLQRTRRLESLGEMAATLAHELKNPVGAIRGYAQLMREAQEAGDLAGDDEEGERIKRAVQTMVRESQRLEELVRRTLEFARPGDLELTTFDLRDVAGEAATLLAGKAEEREVSIVTDHESAEVSVEADRSRIEQVLANLLDNAIAASEPGTNVVISVSSRPGEAICEVRDRGKGIDPTKLDEIFQPFTTTRTDGTGLGLAVSRSIVEAHRGTVRARSEGEGKGAVFTVKLPR
jgi:two-component system sensor histidine kinase HydH